MAGWGREDGEGNREKIRGLHCPFARIPAHAIVYEKSWKKYKQSNAYTIIMQCRKQSADSARQTLRKHNKL